MSLEPIPFPQEGLPSADPQTVMVIGGGLAGLSAAYWLRTAGHEVTLLEAQPRPGGRVRTSRVFDAGAVSEMGATFLPDWHPHPMGFARLLGLSLISFPEYSERVHVDGTLSQEDPERRQLLIEGVEREALAAVRTTDPRAPDWPPEKLRSFDAVTYAEMARTTGASDADIDMIRRGFRDLLGGVHTVSALARILDTAVTGAGANWRFHTVKGGMDRLPTELLARLERDGVEVHLSTPVASWTQKSDEVVVQTSDGRIRSGDRVVCAIPPGPLRALKREPELSWKQRAALRNAFVASVTRVHLQFDRKLWTGPDSFARTDLPDSTDEDPSQPGLWIANQSVSRPQETEVVLDGYYVGEWADRVADMGSRERATFTLAQVEKIYPGAQGAWTGVHDSHAWSDDPWAGGAYPTYRPGEMMSHFGALWSPQGRVHFAGDHCSVLPGWMQGALESGYRVALEINRC